jgi:hypothetical protein
MNTEKEKMNLLTTVGIQKTAEAKEADEINERKAYEKFQRQRRRQNKIDAIKADNKLIEEIGKVCLSLRYNEIVEYFDEYGEIEKTEDGGYPGMDLLILQWMIINGYDVQDDLSDYFTEHFEHAYQWINEKYENVNNISGSIFRQSIQHVIEKHTEE